MKKMLILSLSLSATLSLTACAPTLQSVKSDLQSVQEDLKTIAVNSQPEVQAATTVADIVEGVSGNVALIPITNTVSGALIAVDKAIANGQTPK